MTERKLDQINQAPTYTVPGMGVTYAAFTCAAQPHTPGGLPNAR